MLKKIFTWSLFFILFLTSTAATFGDEKSARETLAEAIQKGDLERVQSMIESMTVGIDEVPEKDYKGLTPLAEAATHGQFLIIKYLIGKGAAVEGLSGKKGSPLNKLITQGHAKLTCPQLMEIARFLIDAGADVNSKDDEGYTPLMNACKYTRCIELMDLLMNLGALADIQGDDKNTAFMLSIRNTNIKAFRLLLSRGAKTSIDCKGLSPLAVAAQEGNIVMAKLILQELKPNVNAYDPVGAPPIFSAALNHNDSMVAFLVENGADINAKTTREILVEKPPEKYRIAFDKTYYVFPERSTPLTFAKWTKSISMINLVRDLGGVEFEQFEIKERTESRWPFPRRL